MNNINNLSDGLFAQAEKTLLTLTPKPDTVMIRGKGSYLYDHKNKKYLDFINGWAVNCLGHAHPVITKALHRQARQLINASPTFYNINQILFGQKLIKSAQLDRVFFCSTGAEANESAIKLARKFGQTKKNGAYEIITLNKSFHGRTLATMSASGKETFKKLFEPKVSGFIHIPNNDINALRNSITDKTCAIMLEPVQGEGGVNIVEQTFMDAIVDLCRQKNILLILDEIQTGLCRTGKMYACEHYHVIPDIMTLGKGIGGGYPLAAMLCKEELNIFSPGEQGGTYTGQPLAMEVGLAILNWMEKKQLWKNVEIQGEKIITRLQQLAKHYPITDIRGKGLLLAFNLEGFDTDLFNKICLNNGLIINTPQPGTIRLIPALNIQQKEIDLLIILLEKSLRELMKGIPGK